MEKAIITFLGTAASIPTRKRNHTSILLNYKYENLLFDCGEGTQRQFKFAKISPTKLTRIFISHWHGDHTLGLLGLLETLSMSEYQKVIHLYGPKGTGRYFALLKEFLGPYKKIKIEFHEVTSSIAFENDEIKVETKPMRHGIPTLAYSFIIKEKLRLDKKKIEKLKLPQSPLLKKLQQGKDIIHNGRKIKSSQVTYSEKQRKITFIFDTLLNENAVELAKESEVLICESSFTQEEAKMAEEKKHLTAKDAGTIAKKSKSKMLKLIHISQRYDANPQPVLNEAKKIFKNTTIANDFDKIEV